MTTKPHVNVLIATPGRNMEAEYVKSLVATMSYLNQNGISYVYLNEYSSQVNAAREATAMGSRFLNAFATEPLNGEITYDKIIWIDSDISWTVEDFMKLYTSTLDIVSGLYFNEEGVPLIGFTEEEIYHDPATLKAKTYPFEIFAAGFGFIAMKSGVFENIPRPWFETVFQKIENEDKTREMFIPYGEDFSWCKKAKEAGYKIYLDPSIRLGHHKKIRVSG
jgi:GT2 family glycosyltransferase